MSKDFIILIDNELKYNFYSSAFYTVYISVLINFVFML